MSKKVIDNMATGARIRELLKEKGLTPQDVQQELELQCPQSVYAWISDKRKSLPSLDNMVSLSQLLDVPIEDILVLKDLNDN